MDCGTICSHYLENEKPTFTGKYYIQMVSNMYSKQKICYRRYKCSDGWSENMEECWAFTKQGALKKIEALKREYHINYDKGLIEFNLVECWE